MTIKRTKTGHTAARAKRQRSVAAKVARARSSDAGDNTSKPMLLGYARVSTVDQNLALQRDALTEAGCAKIFTEQMSGAVADRPALHDALEFARSGDTLIVWKLDRLARSMKQLIETIENLRVRGIGFRSLTEALDTTTAQGVACLPCSDLTYAEASWAQGHEDWLGAHVRAFAYIGGCPKKAIPDNLKTGGTDANYWDPVLNRSYHALGRHYNVAIVPARVRKPRDKPSAENAVRLVEMWVLAPLRHRQFFSLAEANAA